MRVFDCKVCGFEFEAPHRRVICDDCHRLRQEGPPRELGSYVMALELVHLRLAVHGAAALLRMGRPRDRREALAWLEAATAPAMV